MEQKTTQVKYAVMELREVARAKRHQSELLAIEAASTEVAVERVEKAVAIDERLNRMEADKDLEKCKEGPNAAGEAFVAKFKREPVSATDAAWLNGYAYAIGVAKDQEK